MKSRVFFIFLIFSSLIFIVPLIFHPTHVTKHYVCKQEKKQDMGTFLLPCMHTVPAQGNFLTSAASSTW